VSEPRGEAEFGPDGEIRPDWLAISYVDAPFDRGVCVLYFLSNSGYVYESLQYETLLIAMDQAHALTGIQRDEWNSCSVPVSAGGLIPRSLVA
jgi:hypothetical protein